MLYKQLLALAVLMAPAVVQGMSTRAEAKRSSCVDPIELAEMFENLSTVVKALKASDLIPTIQKRETWTFFLPTNDAFDKLPKGTVEKWLKPKNKEKLQNVLLNHVIKGKWGGSYLAHHHPKKSLSGHKLNVDKDDSDYYVNGVDITARNIPACGAWVHLIDEVLVPN